LAAPTNLPIQDGLPVANHDVSIDVNPISACDLADYGNDKTSPAFTVSKILFDFGKLTMTTIVDGDGNPWWVACEVCKVLGYVNSRGAVAKHCINTQNISLPNRYGIRGNPNKAIINESDLYRLITHPHLPAAKDFEC
jgi:hypothetical protein